MYNIIHAWRPSHRRSQTDTGGRAASRSSDARPRGACEARGSGFVGGASKVSRRMGPVEFLTFKTSGQGATTHERGARDFRPGLRGIRLQTAAPQTSSAMRRHRMASTSRNRSTTDLPSLLGLTLRRLPSVASGKPQDDDSRVLNRAGSTLAGPCFGLENGVHPNLTGEAVTSCWVYSSPSTSVYTSQPGSKLSSVHHLPPRLAEFLLRGVNKR
jgi:hypothetical protein